MVGVVQNYTMNVENRAGSRIHLPEFKSCPLHLLAPDPETKCSLGLHFLICKMGTVIVIMEFSSQGCCKDSMKPYT